MRNNKAIGLAIGERSLLAAEIVGGEQPAVTRLAEFTYPAELSLDNAGELGTALAKVLAEHEFSARAVVVGIPIRWLVVKTKEVPPADEKTLSELLRLQAEGEFSSELKDLVYDYTDAPPLADTLRVNHSVLLVATASRWIEKVTTLCDAAKLDVEMITSSAVVLGAVTGKSIKKNSLILNLAGAGAELTAQDGSTTQAIRHLRGPGGDRPFIGELRRAVSTTPGNGSPREMVLWGSSTIDCSAMSRELGFTVRCGELPALGVSESATAANGNGGLYASAVALGLVGVGADQAPFDFLNSRLAPPKVRRIPTWSYYAAGAMLALVIGAFALYQHVQSKQAELDKAQAQFDQSAPRVEKAKALVNTVSTALGWHAVNPRYLACLRDLTTAIPEDDATYATSLIVHEVSKPAAAAGSTANANSKTFDPSALTGVFSGKTSDNNRVQMVLDRIKRNPAFIEASLGGTQISSRGREVSFTISFTYLAPIPKEGTAK